MSDEEITEVATVKVSIKDGKMRELKAAMVARSCEDMEPLRMAIERGREAGLERSEIDNAARILHDLELRTQAVAFTDVPRSDILKLQACGSRDEIVDSLKTLMKLKDKDGFRAEVLAEFHFQNFVFCQKQGYGPEKASALLSMMRVLHSQTVVGKKDIEEAKSLLEDLLARHSRQLPPFSVGIFSQAEVASIRDYATRTFLRHFKMFQFIYQQCKDLRIRTIESRVTARVPRPAPLHTDFELNPHEVPQLQEFLRSEASEEVVDSKEEGAGVEAADRRRVPQSAAEAKVAEVMDEVLKNHLGDLESRMALPN